MKARIAIVFSRCQTARLPHLFGTPSEPSRFSKALLRDSQENVRYGLVQSTCVYIAGGGVWGFWHLGNVNASGNIREYYVYQIY